MIIVGTPYPLDSAKGNVVSATRIAGLLGGLAIHSPEANLEGAETVIALHARKSFSLIEKAAAKPGCKLIVLLTGTDLYDDIPAGNQNALKSLALADALVVAQESSIADIPAEYRSKAHVCHKSMTIDLPAPPPRREEKLITIVGHLREIKNPFVAVLPALELGFEVVQLGRALEPGFAEKAQDLTQAHSSYSWLGGVSREESLHWLSRSTATINSSLMEGGANSVLEALHCDCPVIASDIPGNRGILGDTHPALFSPDDHATLSSHLRSLGNDSAFRQRILSCQSSRKSLFTPEQETSDWLNLIRR